MLAVNLVAAPPIGMLSSMSNNQVFTERIVRRPEVLRMTGLSRSNLYVRMAAFAFPASIKISPRSVGWRLSELNRWIADPMNYKTESVSE